MREPLKPEDIASCGVTRPIRIVNNWGQPLDGRKSEKVESHKELQDDYDRFLTDHEPDEPRGRE